MQECSHLRVEGNVEEEPSRRAAEKRPTKSFKERSPLHLLLLEVQRIGLGVHIDLGGGGGGRNISLINMCLKMLRKKSLVSARHLNHNGVALCLRLQYAHDYRRQGWQGSNSLYSNDKNLLKNKTGWVEK